MKKIWFGIGLMAGLVAMAAPGTVTIDSVTQDAETRLVTVNYSLGGSESAIVTASAVADSKQIELGDKVFGDANCKVAPGSHTFKWQPLGTIGNADYASGDFTLKVKAWALDTPPDFMVIAINCPSYVRYYASAEALPGGIQDRRYFADQLLLRKIPAKNVRYRKGALTTEFNYATYGVETEYVTLTKDFYIGVYECTCRQWRLMTSTYPMQTAFANYTSYDGKKHEAAHHLDWERHPAAGDTWNTITSKVGAFAKASGLNFALPSEAEWEFACRAGCGSELYTGKPFVQANCNEISCTFSVMNRYYQGELALGYADPMPCGLLLPNKWNLYDMMGNVREFCSDDAGGKKIMKGGDLAWSIETCRAGARELIGADETDKYRSGFRFYLPVE